MKNIVLVLFPMLALTSPLYCDLNSSVLLFTLWMVVWWIFEIAPLGVVALIPLIFFPLYQIDSLKVISQNYSHPIIFLFLGGFIIAKALEKTELNKRFSLTILSVLGSSPQRVILGFMLATALLSMWISNTATTVMMIPIAYSVINFIKEHAQADAKSFRNFSVALFLAIAYSANIGGIMTPIGTPPNVVLLGLLEEKGLGVDFFTWMLMAVPLALSILAFCYFALNKIFFRYSLDLKGDLKAFTKNELSKCGQLNKKQKLTLLVFAVTALAWIFKRPINHFVGFSMLHDSTTAMLGGFLLFLPSLKARYKILEASDIAELPWNIVLLFGGGLALAATLAKFGFINQIVDYIRAFDLSSTYVLVLILASVVLVATELMSNVALCNIALPVILVLGMNSESSLWLFVLPCTLAASFAFTMPISTPPNAIVFAQGEIKMQDMMKAGILLNILSILLLMTLGWTLIKYVF